MIQVRSTGCGRVLGLGLVLVGVIVLLVHYHVVPTKVGRDRKSTRLNSSHVAISYAVFCLKKTNKAFKANVELENKRNGERYRFLKWGQGAFDDCRVVPPCTGICHLFF